jgi:hypothetical protein
MIKLKDVLKKYAGRYGGEPDFLIPTPGNEDVKNPIITFSRKGGSNKSIRRPIGEDYWPLDVPTHMVAGKIAQQQSSPEDMVRYVTNEMSVAMIQAAIIAKDVRTLKLMMDILSAFIYKLTVEWKTPTAIRVAEKFRQLRDKILRKYQTVKASL